MFKINDITQFFICTYLEYKSNTYPYSNYYNAYIKSTLLIIINYKL